METDHKQPDLSYLNLLAERYPTVEAAAAELVRLRAFLQLPKGTEYYFSDLHGEHEAFIHLLRSASGTIRDKINAIHGAALPETDLDELASLIYYPEQVIRQRRAAGDTGEWERLMIFRLLPVLQEVSRKYAHDHVDALTSSKYRFVIRELMDASQDPVKSVYYREMIAAAVDAGIGDGLIANLSYQIQQVAVDNLHIIGDLYDRGPGAHKILDELMFHHNVDIQWGNHDIDWIGAAAGNLVNLFSVLRKAISYNNFDMLEDGYGINLRPLSMFADEVYAGDPCKSFRPHTLDENKYDPVDAALAAKMHKAVAVIMFKLEGQLIRRNPNFGLEHRLLLDKLDLEKGVLRLNGAEYPLIDTNFPTLDPADPYALTEGEQKLVDVLRTSFRHCPVLKRHMDFLMNHGSMYKAINGNLLYHGCIPMEADGSFSALELEGKLCRGKAMLDAMDGIVRRAYYQHEPACVDFMWYLWSGAKSPLFGKSRMTTFERYFTDDHLRALLHRQGASGRGQAALRGQGPLLCPLRAGGDGAGHPEGFRPGPGALPHHQRPRPRQEGREPHQVRRPPLRHRRRHLQGLPVHHRHRGLYADLQLQQPDPGGAPALPEGHRDHHRPDQHQDPGGGGHAPPHPDGGDRRGQGPAAADRRPPGPASLLPRRLHPGAAGLSPQSPIPDRREV